MNVLFSHVVIFRDLEDGENLRAYIELGLVWFVHGGKCSCTHSTKFYSLKPTIGTQKYWKLHLFVQSAHFGGIAHTRQNLFLRDSEVERKIFRNCTFLCRLHILVAFLIYPIGWQELTYKPLKIVQEPRNILIAFCELLDTPYTAE